MSTEGETTRVFAALALFLVLSALPGWAGELHVNTVSRDAAPTLAIEVGVHCSGQEEPNEVSVIRNTTKKPLESAQDDPENGISNASLWVVDDRTSLLAECESRFPGFSKVESFRQYTEERVVRCITATARCPEIELKKTEIGVSYDLLCKVDKEGNASAEVHAPSTKESGPPGMVCKEQ